MSILKSLAGTVFILGGVLGIGLCCYVVGELQENSRQLRTEVPATVEQIESVVVTTSRRNATTLSEPSCPPDLVRDSRGARLAWAWRGVAGAWSRSICLTCL